MAEELHQRVLELESDLREERRTRVKLERLLKTQNQERSSLSDELKIEKKAAERNVNELKTAQLEKKKLLLTVDQLNKKLDAASAELVRLRSEIKLKDKIGAVEPHPPGHPPQRRKGKTRSAPSHATGVLDDVAGPEKDGISDRMAELEALLDAARYDKLKADKQVTSERKKRTAARQQMSELAAAASASCDQGQWSLSWVRRGVCAMDSWLSSVRVKDSHNGVWSEGLASTKSVMQYMKAVLVNGSEAMERLQANADRGRVACGLPAANVEARRARMGPQDCGEDGVQALLEEAKQRLASNKQQAESDVPALRLPPSRTPRERSEPTQRSEDEPSGELTSRSTVPGGSTRARERVEGKPKRAPPVLPPSVASSGYSRVRSQRGVKDTGENGRPEAAAPEAKAADNGRAGEERQARPARQGPEAHHVEEVVVNAPIKVPSDKTARIAGGYADQYRKRMNIQRQYQQAAY